jgi:hypothetical protein
VNNILFTKQQVEINQFFTAMHFSLVSFDVITMKENNNIQGLQQNTI